MPWVMMVVYLSMSGETVMFRKYEQIDTCHQIQASVERQVERGKLEAGKVQCSILPADSFNI